jgi:uncharacterized protein YjbJ (UPF0337 family)
MSPQMKQLKGTLTRWLGVTTGDRKTEANGAVQELTGHKPTDREQAAATAAIKESHGDFGTRVPPQRVPHEERTTRRARRAAAR